MFSVATMSPAEAREMIRNNEWMKPTAGVANGYTQALKGQWLSVCALFQRKMS